MANFTKSQAWQRYFAAVIDFSLCSVGVDVTMPGITGRGTSSWVVGGIHLFAYLAATSLFISQYATTPGKSLMGISLRDKRGSLLTPKISFQRSSKSLLYGCGLWAPFVSFFTMWHAYKKMLRGEELSWDSEATLSYSMLSFEKKVAGFLIYLLVSGYQTYLQFLQALGLR